MKMDEVVDKYIKLRDKKDKLKAEYDAKVVDIDNMLDKIEAVMLKQFEETGIDSVKTANGTVYKSMRTSATVADWDAFFGDFVLQNKAWEFLERRANKTAVQQYRAANDDLPPGINFVETRTISVRRS